jgi:hypothetical protein
VPTAIASPQVFVLAAFGLVAGLGLFVKGIGGYSRAARVEGFGTSAIRSVAVGEARLSGLVEAADLTLVSALQSATSEATSTAIRSLFAVVENYPDLRSATNVLQLQEEIERIENVIADRRELYNDSVYRYNTRVAQAPVAVLAPLFGWRPRALFSAEPEDAIRPESRLSAGQ